MFIKGKRIFWRFQFRQRIFLLACFAAAIFITLVVKVLVDVPLFHNQGSLNAHMWGGSCLRTIESLCQFPLFPRAPHERRKVFNLDVSWEDKNFAQRLFGFLEPPESGNYTFAIASDDTSELWLSTDSHWHNSRPIASVGKEKKQIYWNANRNDFYKYWSQISVEVPLYKDQKYYIEVLHIDVGGSNFLHVAWRPPMESRFVTVNAKFLRPYLNDLNLNSLRLYDHRLPRCVSCKSITAMAKNKDFVFDNRPYLPHGAVKKALPTCNYEPSYIVKNATLKKWEAYFSRVIYTKVWPLPELKGFNLSHYVVSTHFTLEPREVKRVVSVYMGAIEKKYPGVFLLKEIKKVERKDDRQKGNRYLLELVVEIHVRSKKRTAILSEYVYHPQNKINQNYLCYPRGLQWNQTSEVYLVVTSQNQGRWIQHFINNVNKIYKETKDDHFHVIIFDYDSIDIDMDDALERSCFKKIKLVREPAQSFVKTKAYNKAVAAIDDPNAIVFLVDLHLELASSLINEIRKRTFQGRTTFTPMLVRLWCGGNPSNPFGFWEWQGFGPVGIYKSDWDQFGGFSKHQEGWGGEDWDLLDSITEQGLEHERIRSPHMYHYFHTKKGMWATTKKSI